MAKVFKFKSIPTEPEATIFCIFISGFTVIFTLIFSRLLMIFLMLSSTLSMDLAPVHTTLPELKIKADVLGSLILITSPGNCSGLYSVLLRVAAIFSSGIACIKDVETTILTTFMSLLVSFLAILDYLHVKNVIQLNKP